LGNVQFHDHINQQSRFTESKQVAYVWFFMGGEGDEHPPAVYTVGLFQDKGYLGENA
jgi:hypothetical protein